MTVFRTLSAVRSLELVHAWANAPWPITWDQAFTIARTLGWTHDPNDEYLFMSELATDEADGYFGTFNEAPSSVEFPLTTLADQGCEAETGPQTRALFAQINEVLETEYRTPATEVGPTGIPASIWSLASGASLRIACDDRFILVRVSSPARTALLNDPAADPNPDECLS